MKRYKIAQEYAKLHHKQAGMTLIELTVVLLILIGLAGLLIPYVGSFTQTTHDTTNASNLAQLNSAFVRYVAEKNRLPPHVDTLINDAAGTSGTGACAGAVAGAIYCGLADTSLFTPVSYTSGSIAATSLANSGINMAVNNDPNIANKTFGTSANMLYLNSPTAAGFAKAKFASVLGVAGVGSGMSAGSVEAHLAKALGRDTMVYDSTCYDYIAVGIGDNNELVQSTMTTAPVIFPQDGTGPDAVYSHYMAILQVDKANSGTGSMGAACSPLTEKAKFLGVVANVPASQSATLVGVGSALQSSHTNRAGG